jgi:hypothetical protein
MHFVKIARIKLHYSPCNPSVGCGSHRQILGGSLAKVVGYAARKTHKSGESIVFLTLGRRLSDMLELAF